MREITIAFDEYGSCIMAQYMTNGQETIDAAAAYYEPLVDILKRMAADGRRLEISVSPKGGLSSIVDKTGDAPPPAPPNPKTSSDEAEARRLNFWPFYLRALMPTDHQRQMLADALIKRLRITSLFGEVLVDHEIPAGSFKMDGYVFRHVGPFECPVKLSGTADEFSLIDDRRAPTHTGSIRQLGIDPMMVSCDTLTLRELGLDLRPARNLLDRILAATPESPPNRRDSLFKIRPFNTRN